MLDIIMVLLALSATGLADDKVDAAQFGQIMKAMHDSHKDISFVYEGEYLYVGPAKYVKGIPGYLDVVFQGTYMFRGDGSTWQQVYKHPKSVNGTFTRSTAALLNWNYEEISERADLRRREVRPQKLKGPPASFFAPYSASRMLFLWFFDALFDPQNQGYIFQGWEDVKGHKCLRVQLNCVPGSASPAQVAYRFWIDLERGGHPLKMELVNGSDVTMRITDIQLELTTAPNGQQSWLPITATAESFLWNSRYYRSPIHRETYKMVDGSMKLNSRLGDEKFSVKSSGILPGTDAIAPQRKAFESTPAYRTDPEGVKLRLEAQLKDADRVSKELDASSATADAGFALGIIQPTLISLGVMALVIALYVKRRRS